ncbi:MAG: hypothetical protein KAH77_03750, partial [Thiomargarita sp.]|nr:hypothetical protein [Thiomargarita sp.]
TPLIPATIIAILVLIMDYDLANSNRMAASYVSHKFERFKGHLWFQGNWGMHYYMQQAGIPKMDSRVIKVKKGDLVVISKQSSISIHVEKVTVLENLTFFVPVSRWGSTMTFEISAGFYSYRWGILPFAFGDVSANVYFIGQYK